MTDSPREPELHGLAMAAAVDVHARVQELVSAGVRLPKRLGDHHRVGSFAASGFPWLIEAPFEDRPANYSNYFGFHTGGALGAVVTYDEIPTLLEVIEFSRQHPRLSVYFSWETPEGKHDEMLFQTASAGLVTDLVDRYIHLHGPDGSLDTGRATAIYRELEAGCLLDPLPCEVLIPIACTRFETIGSLELAPGVRLEELTDETQIARAPSLHMWDVVSPGVASAATHAFVIHPWEVDNPNHWSGDNPRIRRYPLDEVDAAFTTLRIVTGVETGYAHLVLRPLGWAHSFKASLPPLEQGPRVRQYPPDWERSRPWDRAPNKAISSDDLAGFAICYEAVRSHARLTLASQRYSSAELRGSAEDALLDLCIGLEALVGDEDPREMTHKLALRVATVVRLYTRLYDAPDVFSAVKKIYKHRSLIAHGRADSEGPVSLGAKEFSARAVAAALLRWTLIAVVHHPRYRDPGTVDRELLLGGDAFEDEVGDESGAV